MQQIKVVKTNIPQINENKLPLFVTNEKISTKIKFTIIVLKEKILINDLLKY